MEAARLSNDPEVRRREANRGHGKDARSLSIRRDRRRGGACRARSGPGPGPDGPPHGAFDPQLRHRRPDELQPGDRRRRQGADRPRGRRPRRRDGACSTDATGIQFRLLNRGKGPAMHSPRAQCDKKAYQFLAKLTVERQPNLTLRQEMVEALDVDRRPDRRGSLPGRRRLQGPGRRRDDRDVPPGADAHRRGRRPQAAGAATSRPPGSRRASGRSASSCDGSRPARRRGSTAGRSTSPSSSPSRATPSPSRSRS